MNPEKVGLFFKKYFSQIKAKPLANLAKLERLSDQVATGKTKYGARVFNQVYQTARRPQETFHSTCWRDKEITQRHLKIIHTADQVLKKRKIPLYTFWLRSGSGSQTKLWQIFFTKKGTPLALAASIMMEPIFKNPKKSGAKIDGFYFAMPELMEITDEKEPLILVNVGSDKVAYVWVGGSDYPGEIYKPICKAHNGWVFDKQGFEIHGAGYVGEYLNKKMEKEKVLVVISGLSLHGKSALSISNGLQPAFFERRSQQKEVIFQGIHDDYVALLPQKKKSSSWQVFTYAPNGLFPACRGETPGNPLTANKKAALYSVFIDKNGTPDFNKKINQTVNQRAVSPIDSLEVFRNGQRQVSDFDRVVLIILTRNNFCPSGIIFKSPVDFAWSFAGVVVQKTDAIAGDFPDIYYNFACTDFDVVPREKYLERIVKTFKNFPRPVTLAMMNTGAPEVEESMRVRDAIASGWYKAELDENLGVEVITHAPGVKELYLPWKQGGYRYNQVVEEWKQQRKERREFMKGKDSCDPDRLKKLIGEPEALV